MAEATLKAPGGSILTEKDKEEVDLPDYSKKQQKYISKLQGRLESAKENRDTPHVEFDNATYVEHWWSNEKGANTLIKGKKNKGESTYQTGTLRTKMMAYLATLESLNLKPNITAFGEDNLPLNSLGDGMEDVMDKYNEIENDEEKKRLRQYELEKHGTVHVEVTWKDEWIVEKTIQQKFEGDSKEAKWTSKKVKAEGRPIKVIIPNTAIYKGDMTKYLIEEQPYIYTVQIIKYGRAEQIYGAWDMWKYVSKTKRTFSGNVDQSMIQNAWRLMTNSKDGEVEVIKYQDKPNNEFQIILNGIPMIPMGYPLSEVSPD